MSSSKSSVNSMGLDKPISNMTPDKSTKKRKSVVDRADDEDTDAEAGTVSKRRCAAGEITDAGIHVDLGDDDESYVRAVMSQRAVSPVSVTSNVSDDEEPSLSRLFRSPIRVSTKMDEQTQEQLNNMVLLISNLSNDIHKMFNEVNSKMDKMAVDIESRLSKKFSQMVDKRISSEMSRIRQSVQKEMGEMRSEVLQDFQGLEKRVDEISSAERGCDGDVELNIVIRNLPEHEGEVLEQKTSKLLRDGLKLRNVAFESVVRKPDNRPGKHGVIVARCRSVQEKKMIMDRKKQLRQTNEYKSVYLHLDQTRESRLQASNFKTLLSAMKVHVPGLRLNGTRLVLDGGNDRGLAGRTNRAGRRDHDEAQGSRPRGGNTGAPGSSQRGGNRSDNIAPRGQRRDTNRGEIRGNDRAWRR